MSRILKILFAAAFLISGINSSYSATSIISYNMAQLRKRGVDFVACTKRRLPLQIEKMFNDERSPIYDNEYFIMGLQEVWTKQAFKSVVEAAKLKNFTVTPDNYDNVRKSGLITVSNIPHLNTNTIKFNRAKYADKSYLHSTFQGDNGELIQFINTHTDYSSSSKVSGVHLSQVEQLSAQANELTLDPNNKVILVGDFNTGPEIFAVKQDLIYDNDLWSDFFKPEFDRSSLIHIDVEGYSWDLKSNKLAIKPPFVLNVFNLIQKGRTSWEKKSEMVDHIFVSNNINYSNSTLTFNEHVKYKCIKRYDSEKKVPLSDHYGVKSTLQLL